MLTPRFLQFKEKYLNISQGASVLKYVTGSRYAESMIWKDMDVDERVIDNRLLIDAIENGRINPKFRKYPEAMAISRE